MRDERSTEPRVGLHLDVLLHRFDQLEPWLLKRSWPPMTYLLMPGVRAAAQRLALEFDALAPSDPLAAEKAATLRRLLAAFHRLPSKEPP